MSKNRWRPSKASSPSTSRRASARSRRVSPPPRDLSQAVSGVLNGEDAQACFCEKPFVLAGGHEQVVPDRASDRQLVAAKCAGDADRVREEQPPLRPEQTSPIGQDATS